MFSRLCSVRRLPSRVGQTAPVHFTLEYLDCDTGYARELGFIPCRTWSPSRASIIRCSALALAGWLGCGWPPNLGRRFARRRGHFAVTSAANVQQATALLLASGRDAGGIKVHAAAFELHLQCLAAAKSLPPSLGIYI